MGFQNKFINFDTVKLAYIMCRKKFLGYSKGTQ